MKAIVTSRQSLFDIAIQHCGSSEEAFDIAMKNGIGLTDDVANGTELAITSVVDQRMVGYLAASRIQLATSVIADRKGIGFWIIGKDFIVS